MHRRAVIGLLFALAFAANAVGTVPDRRKHEQVDRTIPAAARVVVTACVSSGDLTIRSWDRGEVHARVTEGMPFDLTRQDQTAGPATEIKVLAKGRTSCPPVGDIELDVPRGATVKLQTNTGDITVTDVARVFADSQGGSIILNRIRESVDATTIGGEISIRSSTGAFKLHSVGGSIDARDLSPAEPADTVDADTIGGDVRLERIRHQRVKLNSVSGQLEFGGPLASGGRYSFQSISGQLRLVLPANSSFRLSGSLGSGGQISNDFARGGVANSHKNGMTRRLDTVVGSGDASINISFFSGLIQIRKQ